MLTIAATPSPAATAVLYDIDRKPGRFGHHPNAAIDFEREVDELEEKQLNRQIGYDSEPALERRTRAAMEHAMTHAGLPAGSVERLCLVDETLRREAEAQS